MDHFTIFNEANGVEVHFCPTAKYKTVLLLWIYESPRDASGSVQTILPDLLTRATRSTPGLAAMAARCEDLYAADLRGTSFTIGNRQLTQFAMEFVADEFVTGKPIFDEAISLLSEVIHAPLMEDGNFLKEHFDQERENLVRAIEGLRDDKSGWAQKQLRQEMFAGTPWERHAWGTVDEARDLRLSDVADHWKKMTSQSPVRLFLVGNLEEQDALKVSDLLAGSGLRGPMMSASSPPVDEGGEVKKIEEVDEITQARLSLGYRLRHDVLPGPMATLSGLALGGGSHSRLFKRVREAEGLAYSCYADVQLDSASLTIHAGVDSSSLERAQIVIEEEIARLADSGITEEEFELSKLALSRQLQAVGDSPRGACYFRLVGHILGRETEPSQVLKEVQSIGPEGLPGILGAARLDTVYSLGQAR